MTVYGGDIIYAADLNLYLTRPLCRVVQATAQSATLTDSTDIQVTFDSEEIDTHGFHDTVTNNGRITPTSAGYYEVSAGVYLAARADYASIAVSVRKNGSVLKTGHRQGPNATASVRSVHVSGIFAEMNGTTDYFDVVVNQDNTANAAGSTFVNSTSTSFFQVKYLRPL